MVDEIRATYRLQLNADQPFARVIEYLPYFQRLGISHLYLSPIWQAAPGSQHGYDVLDHGAISEELGGLPGFIEFCLAARNHGLGIMADIVPNHVFVGGARQVWWRDLLRSGRESAFAPYFDIDWTGRGDLPEGVLVLPVLGEPFGACLESGQVGIARADGELVVTYAGSTYPLRASSYRDVFGLPPADLVETDQQAFVQALALLEELQRADAAASAALVAEFDGAIGGSAPVADWLDQRLEQLHGRPGDAASFDALEGILQAQHYRLAYWRVSGEQVNYRRFFDINDLAAVRMEYEPAFRDTHRLVAQLCQEGYLAGLRIDHLDGLADPEGYLRDLRALCPDVRIWVEKIVSADESLPAWPIEGTTGYEFAAHAEGLFFSEAGRDSMLRYYHEFTGEPTDYGAVAFKARRWVADRAFDGDVSGIALELHRLARSSRLHADITLRAIREALTGLLACMPRYRTYIVDARVSDDDRRVIAAAAAEALERDPDIVPGAMSFLVEVLPGSGAADASTARRREIVRRAQQLSAPVMAKGIEDTTFFRFTPFLAQNEVGNSPGNKPQSAEELHRWFAERQEQWPLALSATTTHDTKRSEDARWRIAALGSMPREWRRELRAWGRMNARARRGAQPNHGTEHYLYQTLVAAWDGEGGPEFADRICEHMRKASREAKVWTTWTAPDEEGEAALEAFVRAILDRREGARFRARLERFVATVRPRAERISLSMVALKCLAPGVPDFYQGAESWLLTLTDPDNRRPPDFAELAESGGGGRRNAKLLLTRHLLQLRATKPALFEGGEYVPLEVGDEGGGFAFLRTRGRDRVLVALSPRFDAEAIDVRELARAAGGDRWWDWLTGGKVTDEAGPSEEQRPVAVLTNFRPGAPCD